MDQISAAKSAPSLIILLNLLITSTSYLLRLINAEKAGLFLKCF